MSDEAIHVADVSDGRAGASSDDPGESVELPVVDLLTGRGFVTGKSGGGKSIREGTPVYTESGRRPIEDVTRGDSVLSLNPDTYDPEYKTVRKQIEHADERLLEITLEDGTQLVGTEDHSFLTAEGHTIESIRGDEIEPGVWMPAARKLPSTESVREIDISAYLTDPSGASVSESRPVSAERANSADGHSLQMRFCVGWEIGIFLATGSSNNSGTIQIPSESQAVLSRLSDRTYRVRDGVALKQDCSLARFLDTVFSPENDDWEMPDWVFDTPARFRAGLLSGLFDGSGTHVTGRAAFAPVRSGVAAGIRELLRQFAIPVRTAPDSDTGRSREDESVVAITVPNDRVSRFRDVIEPVGDGACQLLSRLAEQLDKSATQQRDTADMIPNGKELIEDETGPGSAPGHSTLTDGGMRAEPADAALGELGSSKSPSRTEPEQALDRATYNRLVAQRDIGGHAEAFGQAGIQWQQVVSIEPLNCEAQVYDLDVRHNDNFIADGVFVHNSNTVSVVIERLLENGNPCLVVDLEGEYYGLKEEYEVLHAGADDECDIVVSPEHAEKLATLALEQNVPIILDLSGYIEEGAAKDLLLETTRHLFAKEKKLRKPFLMVLEECHEFMPEGGGLDETGKMLIKVGKRGRKHGLGIVGISQRPADVKKDFITQCDWLVWHRLTWDNDTTVVSRILGSDYANAVEDLSDGEAFMMTDWDGRIRRVQFHRKDTFDAGATPGLEDVERPELKSVSGSLVTELEDLSQEQARRESQLADLQQELDKKRQRITQLEHELEQAQDLSQMADQFAQALLGKAEAPYRQTTGRRVTGQTETAPGATDSENSTSAGSAVDSPENSDTDSPTADRTDSESPAETADGSASEAAGSDADDTDRDPEPEDTQTDSKSVSRVKQGPDGGLREQTEDRDRDDLVSRDGVIDSPTEPTTEGKFGTRQAVIEELRTRIEELPALPTVMLRHYRREDKSEPVSAHIDAGGDADTQHAYSRNRLLRRAGLIRHDGRGLYRYAVRELLQEAYADRLPDDETDAMLAEIESSFLPDAELGCSTDSQPELGKLDPATVNPPHSTPQNDSATPVVQASTAVSGENPGGKMPTQSKSSDTAPELGVDEPEFADTGLSKAAKCFARNGVLNQDTQPK